MTLDTPAGGLLERRYRALLRLLPPAYRAAWEEEMVTAFLDTMLAEDEGRDYDPEEPELDTVPWPQVASVASLAVRLRLGGTDAPPRSFAWGQAVRIVALTGLLLHAVTALLDTGFLLWLAGRVPALQPPDDAWLLLPHGPWQTTLRISGLLWVAAFASLIYGRRRAAALLAPLALTPALVQTAVGLVTDRGTNGLSHVGILAFDALPVLALAGFHQSAPPVRPRPWLLALPLATVATSAGVLLGQSLDSGLLTDWPALCALAVTTAGVVRLLRSGGRSTQAATAPWSLALAVLTVAVLALRVLTLLDYAQFAADTPQRSIALTVGALEAAVLATMGASLATHARMALAKLPQATGTP